MKKDWLVEEYENSATCLIEGEDGHFHPRKISHPSIALIQFPEPHVLITDWYLNYADWYDLRTLIAPYAEEAYVSYKKGLYLASVACSATCCEYIIKYEYLRKNRADHDQIINRSKTFGSLLDDQKIINFLNLKTLLPKLKRLNNLRVGYLHFNPDKLKKIAKGKRKGSRVLTSQDFDFPELAFDAYDALQKLLKKFYSKRKQIQYIKECLVDFNKKHLTVMKINFGLSKALQEGYMKKKREHIKKELTKLVKQK
jgi:hypothetical protein